MPVHDWTRVDAGIFHDFQHGWISTVSRALNGGLLPPDHYARIGHATGETRPDVIAWEAPMTGRPSAREMEIYAARANAILIRHTSNHRVIAIVEIVSPGNKNSRHALRAFVEKAVEMLRGGVHLLIVDLFSPGPRDPQGIHRAIWDEFIDNDFALPAGSPLTLAAYMAGVWPEAFVQPTAVGSPLPEMPLFLTLDVYIPVPLEATYQAAWEAVPAFWRNVLAGSAVR